MIVVMRPTYGRSEAIVGLPTSPFSYAKNYPHPAQTLLCGG